LFEEISTKKTLKICYKVSLSKNFQQHICSAIIYISNSINMAGNDRPVQLKFGPKMHHRPPIGRKRVFEIE